MRVLISGGTGLIGRALIKYLVTNGDTLDILTRSPGRKVPTENVSFQYWDGETLGEWQSCIETADAVVNLAGENIGSSRWSETRKQSITESRENTGELLSEAIRLAKNRPEVFIQASAIGIYGTSEDTKFDEQSPLGNDFLSGVGRKWENSSKGVEKLGIRRVLLRTGIVLDLNEGAFPKMYLPFRFFIGGPLGSGKQWVSWIHLDDEVRIIDFILKNPQISGPINAVAPNPVTNAEFGKTLAKVINRPYWIPVPAFALKLILGEMSMLVLKGQYVYPKKLIESDFNFNFSTLPGAIKSILKMDEN